MCLKDSEASDFKSFDKNISNNDTDAEIKNIDLKLKSDVWEDKVKDNCYQNSC